MSCAPPTRLKAFSSRKRSSFACRAGHHLPDLVEEHRAAVRGLEQTALLLPRIREGAALVSEQLRLQQRLRQRRARDVHEGPRCALAGVVDDFCGEILAGSTLTGEQDRRGRAAGDLHQQRFHRLHRRRIPDDPIDAPLLRLRRSQAPHFAAQPRGFEGLLNEQRNLIEVEGLVRVVIRALLHHLDCGVDARVRRQQDHQRVRIVLLDLLQQCQAVGVGQLEVEQDEIDGLFQALQRFAPRRRFGDAIMLGRQPLDERPPNQRLVIDDQDRGAGHWRAIV